MKFFFFFCETIEHRTCAHHCKLEMLEGICDVLSVFFQCLYSITDSSAVKGKNCQKKIFFLSDSSNLFHHFIMNQQNIINAKFMQKSIIHSPLSLKVVVAFI